MKVSIFLLLMTGLVIACNNKPATTEDTENTSGVAGIEAEVLRIHDEVMPKMTDIQHLASQLRERKTTAPKDDSGNPIWPDGLDNNLTRLKQAESVMVDWMKQYSDQRAKVTEPNAEAFYKAELEKIKQVREFMLKALDEANQWVANNPA